MPFFNYLFPEKTNGRRKGTREGLGACSPVAKSEVKVPGFFLFFAILGFTQTGDYPPEELVKFGYRKVMKVEGFKNPVMFWLPAGTCVWKSGDFF